MKSCACAADSGLVDRVQALEATVVNLRLQVQALHARGSASPLSQADQDTLGRLVPVVVAERGSRNFTVKELLQAPTPGLKLVLGDSSSRRLGKLLARGEGTVIATYMIEKIGTEGHAAIWRIVGVVPGVSNSGSL